MNRLVLISSILITFALTTPAQNKSGGMSFSGVFESAVSATAGAGDAPAVSYGIEEYANIRMQSRIGDNATFFGAVNLIAAGGNYAVRASSLGVDIDSGQNYAAMIELERLYLRLKSETINFDAGLMRLPFGFSTVWGPSDFLNPKNPLKPDARPRAVLGGALSWFPIDDFKLQGFAVTGRDPLAPNSGIAGISADRHWDKASIQALYSFERSENFPGTASSPLTHRAGLSLKADVEIGLVMDMLYTYNDNIEDKIDGLSFSAGFDYSLFKANLIIMAEYLYSGAASATSMRGGGSFINENYLYTGLTWRFSDFTNAGAALITGIDDASFTPMMTFNHEISQGVSLTAMAQIPLDKDLLFGDGNRGEFGPTNIRTHFYLETKIKVRF
ncbi:MAG: hypothetical protein FWB94_08820 [Chitinispirillia bacterium]|nr:hypothetical protein [Chitinispirillia bacterium]